MLGCTGEKELKERKQTKKKSRVPVIVASVAIAISVIVVIGYFQFDAEEPVEVYYNLKFINGSRIWVPSTAEMPFTLSNGTIIIVTPEELVKIIKVESFQIKTINLKTGITNYFLHQTEGMGTSSKN